MNNFDWKTEAGKQIVGFVNDLRNKGMRNWDKIAERVNDNFNIDFHKDKIRKSWRNYGQQDVVNNTINSNKASLTVNKNTLEAESKGNRIKTLEALIEECEIDKNIWSIYKHIINKWEVGTKAPNGDIVVEPLFQVKAWLEKHIPDEKQFPTPSPVNISVKPLEIKKYDDRDFKCALIIPDSQIGYHRNIDTGKLDPFHDRKAFDLAVQIAVVKQPDKIILLGDMVDLPDWSDKFLASPEFYFTSQPAFIELAWWIGRLRQIAPNAEIDYLEGNHEYRMKQAIVSNLISAYNLRPANNISSPPAMSISNLLGLEDMNVKYHPDYPKGEVWLNSKLRCRHGNKVRKGGGATSRIVLQDIFVSEIYGHSHRFEHSCKTVVTSSGIETFHSFSPGTISRIDGSVPGNTSSSYDWQQGLGLVYYDDKYFNINSISISNGSCILDGMILYGEDHVEDLIKDTNWKFF